VTRTFKTLNVIILILNLRKDFCSIILYILWLELEKIKCSLCFFKENGRLTTFDVMHSKID